MSIKEIRKRLNKQAEETKPDETNRADKTKHKTKTKDNEFIDDDYEPENRKTNDDDKDSRTNDDNEDYDYVKAYTNTHTQHKSTYS